MACSRVSTGESSNSQEVVEVDDSSEPETGEGLIEISSDESESDECLIVTEIKEIEGALHICCNPICRTKQTTGFRRAPVSVLRYYGQTYTRGKLREVCDQCHKTAARHFKRMKSKVVKREPIIEGYFPHYEKVISLDPAEFSDNEPLDDSITEHVAYHASDIINSLYEKCDIKFQLEKGETLIAKRITDMECNLHTLTKMTENNSSRAQKLIDQFYKDFAPIEKQLSPIEIMDTDGPQSCEDADEVVILDSTDNLETTIQQPPDVVEIDDDVVPLGEPTIGEVTDCNEENEQEILVTNDGESHPNDQQEWLPRITQLQSISEPDHYQTNPHLQYHCHSVSQFNDRPVHLPPSPQQPMPSVNCNRQLHPAQHQHNDRQQTRSSEEGEPAQEKTCLPLQQNPTLQQPSQGVQSVQRKNVQDTQNLQQSTTALKQQPFTEVQEQWLPRITQLQSVSSPEEAHQQTNPHLKYHCHSVPQISAKPVHLPPSSRQPMPSVNCNQQLHPAQHQHNDIYFSRQQIHCSPKEGEPAQEKPSLTLRQNPTLQQPSLGVQSAQRINVKDIQNLQQSTTTLQRQPFTEVQQEWLPQIPQQGYQQTNPHLQYHCHTGPQLSDRAVHLPPSAQPPSVYINVVFGNQQQYPALQQHKNINLTVKQPQLQENHGVPQKSLPTELPSQQKTAQSAQGKHLSAPQQEQSSVHHDIVIPDKTQSSLQKHCSSEEGEPVQKRACLAAQQNHNLLQPSQVVQSVQRINVQEAQNLQQNPTPLHHQPSTEVHQQRLSQITQKQCAPAPEPQKQTNEQYHCHSGPQFSDRAADLPSSSQQPRLPVNPHPAQQQNNHLNLTGQQPQLQQPTVVPQISLSQFSDRAADLPSSTQQPMLPVNPHPTQQQNNLNLTGQQPQLKQPTVVPQISLSSEVPSLQKPAQSPQRQPLLSAPQQQQQLSVPQKPCDLPMDKPRLSPQKRCSPEEGEPAEKKMCLVPQNPNLLRPLQGVQSVPGITVQGTQNLQQSTSSLQSSADPKSCSTSSDKNQDVQLLQTVLGKINEIGEKQISESCSHKRPEISETCAKSDKLHENYEPRNETKNEKFVSKQNENSVFLELLRIQAELKEITDSEAPSVLKSMRQKINHCVDSLKQNQVREDVPQILNRMEEKRIENLVKTELKHLDLQNGDKQLLSFHKRLEGKLGENSKMSVKSDVAKNNYSKFLPKSEIVHLVEDVDEGVTISSNSGSDDDVNIIVQESQKLMDDTRCSKKVTRQSEDLHNDVMPLAEFQPVGKMKLPVGEIIRPPLKVDDEVYAAGKNILCGWSQAVITDFVIKDQETYYTVKIDEGSDSICRKIPSYHIAYAKPPTVSLSAGLRVVALRDKVFSGMVAEPPKSTNKYRYLIFFDNGTARYISPEKVRLIVGTSYEGVSHLDFDIRLFFEQYMQEYPERALLKVQERQEVKTEVKGYWCKATVEKIDAALVKMYFPTHKRSEWIYRGSQRLQPLYKSVKSVNKEETFTRMRGAPRMKAGPYIQYIREEEEEKNLPGDAKKTASECSMETRKGTDVSCTLTRVPIVTNRLDGEVEKQKIHLPKRSAYRPHECSKHCLRSVRDGNRKLKNVNPLQKPLRCGWQREFTYVGRKRHVMYVNPCGRRCRSMKELYSYLMRINCNLTIDYFTFAPHVDCFTEVVNPEKYFFKIEDISKGKEKNVAVPCINTVNNQRLKEDLVYCTSRIATETVKIVTDQDFLVGCNCTDGCLDKEKCSCWQLTLEGIKNGPEKKMNKRVGYRYRRLLNDVPTGIYECNSNCTCSEHCLNRVVQFPMKCKLQVFMTENRGWGIRCLNDIPKGTFICLYTGKVYPLDIGDKISRKYGSDYQAVLNYIEVVENYKEGYESSVEEEDDDEDCNTQVSTKVYGAAKKDDQARVTRSSRSKRDRTPEPAKKERRNSLIPERFNFKELGGTCITKGKNQSKQENKVKQQSEAIKLQSTRSLYQKNDKPYVIEAFDHGNISRFINHSCNPNIFVQNVFVDTHDLRFPWVCFFAERYIPAMSELTWDYNYEVGLDPDRRIECRCAVRRH